jgi:hypothetical protein
MQLRVLHHDRTETAGEVLEIPRNESLAVPRRDGSGAGRTELVARFVGDAADGTVFKPKPDSATQDENINLSA